MSGDDRVRVRVVVSGSVQGVWFRESCRAEAEQRQVAGWVRNRPDGTVEAEFEGSPVAVSEMVAWCRVGPPHAAVVAVDQQTVAPVDDQGFRVR